MLVLSSAFGLLAAAHVALLFGLLRRPRRWRVLVVLLVPPLAPFWGWEEELRAASAVWVGALLVYGVTLMSALL